MYVSFYFVLGGQSMLHFELKRYLFLTIKRVKCRRNLFV